MPLNLTDKKSIIAYRIEKSGHTMTEAEDNAKLGHWSLVANRLYYTLFHMASALLLDKGIHFKRKKNRLLPYLSPQGNYLTT